MHRNGWWLVLLCGVLGIRIVGWQLGLPLGALLLASLLLHEAGHMLAAALLKVPVREFGLELRGTYIRRAHATRRRDEILIAASGPLMNLLLVVPLLFVPRLGPQLATCNLLLGVINLLPLPSSDGLRILRNLSGSIVTGDADPALSSVQPS
jgi:Zn-dependent protease